MRLNIIGHGFGLTPALVQHVESRIDQALGFASDQINSIAARLSDVNAGRGGTDKRCRLTLNLRYMPTVVVDALHDDLYAAIDEAVRRARESLRRNITRRRTMWRDSASRLVRRQPA